MREAIAPEKVGWHAPSVTNSLSLQYLLREGCDGSDTATTLVR